MSLKKDNPDAANILQQAAESGINYFDTADLYEQGYNEILVGKALREKRKNIFLATKVGNQWRPDGSGWDWNPSRSYILKAVEESLKRLGTDYIDLYQLHGGTMQDPIDETIAAFEELVQQGKVRYYGISSIRPVVIRNWLERSHLSEVMLQYSLLDRRPEETILPLLQNQNIGVMVRGAIAQGLLIDKSSKPYLGHDASAVEKAAKAIAGISGNRLSAALGFVWHHPAVTSIVAGIRTSVQLQEALKAAEAPPLTETQYEMLQHAVSPLLYTEHR